MSGPVSTMADITAETLEMLGIRTEIRNSGIDHAAPALHQAGQARAAMVLGRSLKHKPQPLLDQILQLAAAQCGLSLGPSVQVIWDFDGGFHRPSRSHKTI